MVYVISDLHGYPLEKLQKLLNKAGFSDNDFLYILGDAVDRNGDGGAGILRWLLYQPNVQLILGNHETMLLGCSFVFEEIDEDFEKKIDAEKISILQNYMENGGDLTLKAMQKLSWETQQDILDYLKDCPLYETLAVNGRKYILVHSGLGGFSPEKKLEDYSIDELLWNWTEPDDKYYSNAFTIFGHKSTMGFGKQYEGKTYKTDTWMDIDVGAGYGNEPVLVRLDDMAEFRLDS